MGRWRAPELRCDRGIPAVAIPEAWQSRVEARGEVTQTEPYLNGPAEWGKDENAEGVQCYVVGAKAGAEPGVESLGLSKHIPPAVRWQLAEPDTVAVLESDRERLGLSQDNRAEARISQQRVRVVTMPGTPNLDAPPFVFCSVQTARHILPSMDGRVTFVLAKCRQADQAEVWRKNSTRNTRTWRYTPASSGSRRPAKQRT